MSTRWFFGFLRDTHPQRRLHADYTMMRAHVYNVRVCMIHPPPLCVRTMIGYYDIDGIVLSGTVCRPDDDKWPCRGKKNVERQKNKIKMIYEKYTLVNRIERVKKKVPRSLSRQLFFSVPPFNYTATKVVYMMTLRTMFARARATRFLSDSQVHCNNNASVQPFESIRDHLKDFFFQTTCFR